ncbi:unnamed protein product [Dicrocoelium dendriticum]|nr:unnamed protein product [Dicrocoelium dendriticum]
MVFTFFRKLFSQSKTRTPKERINTITKKASLNAALQQTNSERGLNCSQENQPHADSGPGRTYQQSSINRKLSVKRSQSDISVDQSNISQSCSLGKYLEDLVTCQKVECWVEEWEQARFRKSVAESAEWFFTQAEVDNILHRTECESRLLVDKKVAPNLTLKPSSQKRHVELVREVVHTADLKEKTNPHRESPTTSTELSASSVPSEGCVAENDPADGSVRMKPQAKVLTNRLREGQSQFQRKGMISRQSVDGYTISSFTADGSVVPDSYSSGVYAFKEGDNLRSTYKFRGKKPVSSNHFGGKLNETRHKKVRSNQRLAEGQISNVVSSMGKSVVPGQIQAKNFRVGYSDGNRDNIRGNTYIPVLMPSGECGWSVTSSKSGGNQQMGMHPMTDKGTCVYKATPMNQYGGLKKLVHSTSPSKSGILKGAHKLVSPTVSSSVESCLKKPRLVDSGGNQVPLVNATHRSTKSQRLQTKATHSATAQNISRNRRLGHQYSRGKSTGAEDKRLAGNNPNLSAPHMTQVLRRTTRNTHRYSQSQGLNPPAGVVTDLRKTGKGSLNHKARRTSAADLKTKGCSVKGIRKVISTSEVHPSGNRSQNMLSGVNESQGTQGNKAETNRIPMSISTYTAVSLRRLMLRELENSSKYAPFQANNHNGDLFIDLCPHPTAVASDERAKNRKLKVKVFKKELPSQLCSRIRKPLCYSSQAHNDVASGREECKVQPLMQLDELKSYTLSGSTQSVPRKDRVRSAEETSDTFIPSVASEFLHSSSDEQLALKHRPRPGVAPGRGKTAGNKGKEVSSSQIFRKRESEGTDRFEQHETTTAGKEWKRRDQKSDGHNTLEGMTAKKSEEGPRVPDQIVSKTSRSCSNKRYKRKYRTSKRKHLMGRRIRSGLRRNQRHPRRASQCVGVYVRRSPLTGYKKAPIQMTRGTRIPWNFSPRNPALRYYDIRPIESALWPDGRVPDVDQEVPRKLAIQRYKTRWAKCTPETRRYRIRGKHNLIETWMCRRRLNSNEQERKREWPNGSACMYSRKQSLDRNLTETRCSTNEGMGMRRKVEQHTPQSLRSSKTESKNAKTNDFHDTGKFLQAGERARVPSMRCQHSSDKIRGNAVTEKRRKKSPPLWSAVAPRKTSSEFSNGRRRSQSLSNSCKPRQRRGRDHKPTKQERRAQVNPIQGGFRSPTLMDFIAYVSVIPSEIDEMVLPFRACNLLRSYLKDINKLLRTLESEVTDYGEVPLQDDDFAPNVTATVKDKPTKPCHRFDMKKDYKVIHLLHRLRNRLASTKRERRRIDINKSLHRHIVHNLEGDGANRKSSSSVRRSMKAETMSMGQNPENAPCKVRYWQQLLRDIHEPMLSQLLQRLSAVTDRRIYAIEKQNECRIHLDEKTIYCVRGLPCMKLTISSSKRDNVQRALVQLQAQFPNIFKQIIYTERFCGRSLGSRIPTDCKLIFGTQQETSQRHTSSNICHVIPVIEKAKKQKTKPMITLSMPACE